MTKLPKANSGTVGFGIIGLGIGKSRARMVLEAQGAVLQAICDLRLESAQEAGNEFSCDWTTSPHELISRDDVDVVGTARGVNVSSSPLIVEEKVIAHLV